jgi:hypothetical protein
VQSLDLDPKDIDALLKIGNRIAGLIQFAFEGIEAIVLTVYRIAKLGANRCTEDKAHGAAGDSANHGARSDTYRFFS